MSYHEAEQTWDGELRIKRGTNHAVPIMEIQDYNGNEIIIYNVSSLMVLREQVDKQIAWIENMYGRKYHFTPVEFCVIRGGPHRHIVRDDEEASWKPRFPSDRPGRCIWSSEHHD